MNVGDTLVDNYSDAFQSDLFLVKVFMRQHYMNHSITIIIQLKLLVLVCSNNLKVICKLQLVLYFIIVVCFMPADIPNNALIS